MSHESYFSVRHLTRQQIGKRTSTFVYTSANIVKLYIGIAFLGVPEGFADAGIYGAIMALLWILIINIFTTYLLVKARNKFKHLDIVNLSDLAVVCYGPTAKFWTDVLIVATQGSFLVAYNIYFGDQFDQLACKSLKIAECGNSAGYRTVFDFLLLPILLQRQMKQIGYFSIFCLVSTLLSIILIVVLEVRIFKDPTYGVESMKTPL